MSLCSIPGCKNPVRYLGLCNQHYMRKYRYGDPLMGGPMRGEPAKYFAEVVLPYEGDECLTWPFLRNRYGYGKVSYKGRRHSVHRLACEAQNGPPPSPRHEAAHTCGQGANGCCAKRHLVWKTHSENMADMAGHGTSRRGEKNPFAKASEDDVRKVLSLRGKLHREIAQIVGMSRQNVSRILSGQIWTHIEKQLYEDEVAKAAWASELEDAA